MGVTLPANAPDQVIVHALCKTDGDDSSFEWLRVNARYYSGHDYVSVLWP